MNYGQQLRNSVTMIDDLPELNDVESSGMGNSGIGRAGMSTNNPRANPHPSGYQLAHNPHIGENLPPEAADKYRRMIRHRHIPNAMAGMNPYQSSQQVPHHIAEEYSNEPVEQGYHEYDNPALTGISCLEISKHVKDCPICSKFYNCDKTIYIIVIVVLSIIVLLLLKKVLDV